MSARDEVVSFIKRHESFLLATHLNPDGDALGSALALSLALDSMGKRNVVFNRDGVPAILAFLPGAERVRASLAGLDTSGMALVLLDCNSPERAAIEGVRFKESAVIDHHLTEKDFGDLRWLMPSSPATGLMVYEMFTDMGVGITGDMARNLYAALAVDTGTFRFPNTNSAVLKAAAALVEAGADPGGAADELYRNWSMSRFALFMKTMEATGITGPVAMGVVTLEMFKATETEYIDTDNFVNFPLFIKGVKVSALLREREGGQWKVSLRSKGEANVTEAAMRFGGGGHANAAGCTMEGDLAEVKRALLEELKKLPGIA